MRAAQGGSGEALEALFKLHWPAAFRLGLLHRPRLGSRRGHRAGGVPGRRAGARPLRRQAPVRALDQPDRGQPRDRLRPRSRALRREVGAELADARRGAGAGRGDLRRAARRRWPSSAPEQRAVVVLRYLLDWTPGEIAPGAGIPRGTVNSRLRRALDRLAGALEEEEMNERELRRALRERPVPGEREAGGANAARAARRPRGGGSLARPPAPVAAAARRWRCLRALAALGHGAQPGGSRRAPLDRRSARPRALPDALARSPPRGGCS